MWTAGGTDQDAKKALPPHEKGSRAALARTRLSTVQAGRNQQHSQQVSRVVSKNVLHAGLLRDEGAFPKSIVSVVFVQSSDGITLIHSLQDR
jgi:hypothetical protein